MGLCGNFTKETTGMMKRTKQSGHMTTKCQSTANQCQQGGLGLIKLFPWNMNHVHALSDVKLFRKRCD